jgi:N-acyl-D-amino-acid deacylase
MHDLVVRGGTLADGTGAALREADVAIRGGRIVEVGQVTGAGREEVDARGLLVTPGFVDVHTHYDGQATWDPVLAPSSHHGVTTAVMGNCGVGFAPAAPDRHDWLIQLMEGVEDIPGAALAEGLTWGWETFPEYLDRLEQLSWTMDLGTQVPHGSVRAYVMGERGARNEEATASDIARMARIVEEGIRAGALGFSTSRTMLHRARDGEPVPGTFAGRDELLGIGRAMGRAGAGVFEMASDLNPATEEFGWMKEFSKETGLPVCYALLQSPVAPDAWRDLLRMTEQAVAEGANVRAQIAPRNSGVLMNWRASVHPFVFRPSWTAIKDLPWPEQLAALKDPLFREKLLAEPDVRPDDVLNPIIDLFVGGFWMMYELGEQPDYEPDPATSMAARAAATGADPRALIYDAMMAGQGAHEGTGFVLMPLLNYANGNFNHIAEMLAHPHTLLSLADGGAHCGAICDASYTTYLLSHWAREGARGGRSRGAIFPVEEMVRRQTSQTAAFYGLHDRGIVAPGYLGDLLVIDHDRLALKKPRMVFDLPAGGRRMMQDAEGYVATIKRGTITFREGVHTGALPGRLLRGPQGQPLRLAAE